MKSVLELLQKSAALYPKKAAVADDVDSLSYSELNNRAKAVGTFLSKNLGTRSRAVAVIMKKCPDELAAFFGVAYSNNFYVCIDCEMPDDRIVEIFKTVRPVAVIFGDNFGEKAKNICDLCDEKFFSYSYSEMICTNPDDRLLKANYDKMIDTDPLYALFTSGSTGVPKGAVVSHRAVLSYAAWVSETFDINENTVFGNQTPFYFSMSVTDIYSSIMNGSTIYIIPKQFFSFPIKLIEFLNEKRINTIYWVPTALSIVANWDLFKYAMPITLKKVLFAGEVMPVKQLNYWIKHLNGVMFANLYGPTEVTDICCYYIVNRGFDDSATLPIGRPCNNCDCFIVADDGTEVTETDGREGELYARGSFLSYGYYANKEKTDDAFVQNPLNPYYPETVYRTGDIVKYNEYGEIEYIGRRDFQIKHMGYRIELGEIEAAANSFEGIQNAAVIYDDTRDEIVLFYEGKKIDETALMTHIRSKVPHYMEPNVVIKYKNMPINANGKIDRKKIKNDYLKR